MPPDLEVPSPGAMLRFTSKSQGPQVDVARLEHGSVQKQEKPRKKSVCEGEDSSQRSGCRSWLKAEQEGDRAEGRCRVVRNLFASPLMSPHSPSPETTSKPLLWH